MPLQKEVRVVFLPVSCGYFIYERTFLDATSVLRLVLLSSLQVRLSCASIQGYLLVTCIPTALFEDLLLQFQYERLAGAARYYKARYEQSQALFMRFKDQLTQMKTMRKFVTFRLLVCSVE